MMLDTDGATANYVMLRTACFYDKNQRCQRVNVSNAQSRGNGAQSVYGFASDEATEVGRDLDIASAIVIQCLRSVTTHDPAANNLTVPARGRLLTHTRMSIELGARTGLKDPCGRCVGVNVIFTTTLQHKPTHHTQAAATRAPFSAILCTPPQPGFHLARALAGSRAGKPIYVRSAGGASPPATRCAMGRAERGESYPPRSA
jgi:hypothetical protein